MMLPRPPFPRLAAAAAAVIVLLPATLPTPLRAQRYVDDPLPVNTVDFRPMDIAQMNLDGPPPPLSTPTPVTAPGGDTGGTRGLPATPRDVGNGIGRTVVAAPSATPVPGTIRLNFQNASLTDVLNSLSASAGFIIVQEQPVSGTISLVSQQPVTADEAVDALNTVLADKGYASIRSGRVLKIIPREGAVKRDLPVIVNADPQTIPRKDNLVTQIIPVRYLEVGKLVDTLRPLLSDNAAVSSNDASNALLLTDTQVNIHRIAEIVRALDTNVSSISLIRVYTLRYADAKELADVITQLFSPNTNNRNGQQQGFPGGFPFFGGRGGQGGGRGGGQQGGGGNNASPESAAREAAARVVAVADETTNSLVVSAPDEYMSAIEDIVKKLDTSTTELTETQIFKLVHADANELATALTTLYADTTTLNGNNNNNRGGQQGGNRFGPQPQPQVSATTDRERAQARVVVVADPRTNSVLVNASRATMAQIALTIGRLDSTDARKQHIYVHTLTHADPSNVAYILNGMFSISSTAGTSGTAQPSDNSRLYNRTTQGASSNIADTLGSNTGGNSSSSRR